MDPHFNVWFEIDGAVATSRWRIELLAAVDRLVQSPQGPSDGRSLRVAWQKIHEMQVRLGEELLDTKTGGSQGGGATSPLRARFMSNECRRSAKDPMRRSRRSTGTYSASLATSRRRRGGRIVLRYDGFSLR